VAHICGRVGEQFPWIVKKIVKIVQHFELHGVIHRSGVISADQLILRVFASESLDWVEIERAAAPADNTR
jgi:hypothetical protein